MFFGPITMSHPISQHMPECYNTYEFWVQGVDMEWLPVMDEVWILFDEGWGQSRGVVSEIEWAHEHNIPVRAVQPVTLEVYPMVSND